MNDSSSSGSNLLNEWLVHQLGMEVPSLRPASLCSMFRNGVLIGKLLRNSYVVTDDEYSLLVDRDDDDAIVRANFERLRAWLAAVDLPLDAGTVDGIMAGRRPDVVGFLYRLCTVLEDPNRLHTVQRAKRTFDELVEADFLAPPDDVSGRREQRLAFPVCDDYASPPSTTVVGKRRRGRDADALFEKIGEFERDLPGKLDGYKTRGDRSCAR